MKILSHKQKISDYLWLLLLTAGALLVQGYHPFVEDSEIYLPGVEKILHPELFPVGREFFLSHASLTFFPNVIAFSLRVTHLPMEVGLSLWQLASIFLLLLACWELSRLFFSSARAQWGGVCLVAVLLTIPVSGTALYIMDQYLNPRNLAAFAGIFALVRTLEKNYVRALLWLAFAACMHPLMWVFPFSFCLLFVVMDRFEGRWKALGATRLAALLLLPLPLALAPSSAYHEAAKRHPYHYIQNWAWYELLGIVAPLVLFWWLGRIARRREWRTVERVSRTCTLYGSIYLVGAVLVDLPARFEALARLQPLRSLHFLYIVMFVMVGGFLGESVLQNRVWRWLLLFAPLSVGMFMAQRALFPASAHLEWPGAAPKNPWAQAFVWIRQNTPASAVFALDPYYMDMAGEDEIGFRCLAERSRLADGVKDNGVVSMFPPLAEEWWSQVQAQTPWKNFRSGDFSRLKQNYGVSWVVVETPPVAELDCVYQNGSVRVCRLP
ncbi:MAG TPA: hypothetical protein VMU26_16550 [Candidatus Polarisedimenticolia bacterium]|nr:hypothetical protein [Candidatus Polarisedimenticolia bacterium]